MWDRLVESDTAQPRNSIDPPAERKSGGFIPARSKPIELRHYPILSFPGLHHELPAFACSCWAAAATAAHFKQFESFDRARGHCPMFGYSTNEVIRDRKFRLSMYLREAGVAESAAAHSAVMRTVGPLPEAPF